MSTQISDAWEKLRARTRHEPITKRIRAQLGDREIVDSTEAMLFYEPRRITPMYAVPEAAVRAELRPAGPVEPGGPELIHPGIPFTVHSAPGESLSLVVDGQTYEHVAFRPADPDLAGYVALDFTAFQWREEDEPVVAHPRDPYHRIDVRASSRHVRIADGDRVLADSTRPVLVFETSLPVRFYLPREDIVADLGPGDMTSYCPYKGEASYWTVGGRDNIAWSYEKPLIDATQLAGLIAFWDDVLDVQVDGKRHGRADSEVAQTLREEFSV